MSISSHGPQVTIIGAGIIGINIALQLQKAGLSTLIIDKGAPAAGCSSGNAGVIGVYAVTPVSMPGLWKQVPKMLFDPMGPLTIRWQHLFSIAPWLIKFLRAGKIKEVEKSAAALSSLVSSSFTSYQQLLKGTGLESLLVPSDLLAVYPSKEHFERDHYAWDLRKRHGLKWSVLKNKELHEKEPALAENYKYAVAIKGSGFVVDPKYFTYALFEEYIKNGGQFQQVKVNSIKNNQGQAILQTSQGFIKTNKLVIAMGAFSAALTKCLGEPVPLQQERGYHITLTEYKGITPKHAIISPQHKVIATPMQCGLRIAGMVEFGGFLPPNYKRSEVLKQQLQELFPSIQEGQSTSWMGHRPTLPDSLPVIDQSKTCPAVYYAFGHQHVGLTSGPATARLVAQLITEQELSTDITPFSLKRF